MFNLLINDKKVSYQKPVTLEQVAKDQKIDNALVATVDSRLRELSFSVDSDAKIVFLTLKNSDAVRIYEASLRYVIANAVYNLYPNANVKFNFSISRSVLGVLSNMDVPITESVIENITKEVRRIVDADYPITRKKVSIAEATKIFEKEKLFTKIDILRYREEDTVNLYESNGYINYMSSYMVPSTGYLKEFNIFQYNPGFLIQYPRAEFDGKIPPFVDAPTFGMTLKEAARWGKITNGNTIPRINDLAINTRSSVDFVNMCETKHNNMLCELGGIIHESSDDIKLIAIAGPSSSGKTTFSNRLRIELLTRGLHPVMISIDDYYLGKDQAPKDEHGKPDLEHIEALDIALFNKDMLDLIQGKEVTLPHFNFMTGKREEGRKIKLNADMPVIIEGIHALNDMLTSRIPKHQKFKIYIAPQTQLHVDDHNPISITDLRLLRRIVRDQKYRNSPATSTMAMWPSVRRGEFKWIYPYQEDANYVFNSELSYEFNVLKKHALQQLLAIPADSEYYVTANRLIKFLKYFKEIDENLVPCNSLLREFIGGSNFE